MSVLTTKTLTRKQAVGIIAGKIFTATNEQLENMLDAIGKDELNNFIIVDRVLDDADKDSVVINRKDIYG